VEEIENSEIYLYIGGLEYNSITFEQIEQIKQNNKWYEPWFEYAIGAGIGDSIKFQKTQDALTAPYYVENRRHLI